MTLSYPCALAAYRKASLIALLLSPFKKGSSSFK